MCTRVEEVCVWCGCATAKWNTDTRTHRHTAAAAFSLSKSVRKIYMFERNDYYLLVCYMFGICIVNFTYPLLFFNFDAMGIATAPSFLLSLDYFARRRDETSRRAREKKMTSIHYNVVVYYGLYKHSTHSKF